MNPDSLNNFYSSIQTTDDILLYAEGLKKIQNSLFSAKGKDLIALKSVSPIKVWMVFEKIFNERKIDPNDLMSVKNLLKELLGALDSLQQVTLTLAIDPPQKTLDGLSEGVKKAFGIKTVMALEIDPEILGGAIIVVDGKYLDYSLRKKLNIIFEARKEEISQSLVEKHI